MKAILILINLFIVSPILVAFSPATPERYVVASEGRYFIVVDPGNFSDIPAKAIAYEAFRDKVEKLWEVTGWDSEPGELLLSQDGKFLVRICGAITPKGKEQLAKEEVLFFYLNGKLIKKYTLQELVSDLGKGVSISSMPLFASWINREDDKSPKIAPTYLHRVEAITKDGETHTTYPSVLHLTTLEGSNYLFDINTGLVIKKNVVAPKEVNSKRQDEVDPFR
jgi:hypothetical protein